MNLPETVAQGYEQIQSLTRPVAWVRKVCTASLFPGLTFDSKC